MKAPAAIKMYASCSMTVGSVNSCKKLGCYWWCHINASSIKRKLLKEESGKRKSRNQTLVWHITWSLQRYNTTRLQWCIFQNFSPKWSHHLFCNKFIAFYTKSMYAGQICAMCKKVRWEIQNNEIIFRLGIRYVISVFRFALFVGYCSTPSASFHVHHLTNKMTMIVRCQVIRIGVNFP